MQKIVKVGVVGRYAILAGEQTSVAIQWVLNQADRGWPKARLEVVVCPELNWQTAGAACQEAAKRRWASTALRSGFPGSAALRSFVNVPATQWQVAGKVPGEEFEHFLRVIDAVALVSQDSASRALAAAAVAMGKSLIVPDYFRDQPDPTALAYVHP